MTKDNSSLVIDDPFAHLHNERYEQEFSLPIVGANEMVFVGGRTTISLNGKWRFVLDRFNEGLRQRWFEYDDTPVAEWTVPRDYDSGDWQQIDVPACWNTQKPEWTHYEGAAWYSCDFEHVVEENKGRIFLRVGAANYISRVFLNGKFLALHRGGFAPFFVELTGFLVDGANTLKIQVDNTRSSEHVPMDHFDWFNDGGIFRDVDLISVQPTFISDLQLSLTDDGVDVHVRVAQEFTGTVVVAVAELFEIELPVVKGQGNQTVRCTPKLWSPKTPYLYDATATLGQDKVTDTVGFREIKTIGTDIVLNGAVIDLRGICVHEDDGKLGHATSEHDIRRRLQHALELGCNALRLAHYPHHELVAKLADELGLLLWVEIPVYWAIDFNNPKTIADAQNQLAEMIRRDFNRASIIIWGVGNENEDSDARYSFMAGLAETARSSDPSRLVAAACLINRTSFQIEDRLAAHLDIIGLNEYFGWYEPSFDGLVRLLDNSKPGKPVVISETGADAVAGHRGPATELFTEDHQENVIRQQAEISGRYPYVAGFFPWLLYDFRSERRQTGLQRGWNLKGLIAQDKRTRKAAFYALSEIYHQRAAKKLGPK